MQTDANSRTTDLRHQEENMKTFHEWFKEQKNTDSLSELLILCKQAWYDGQRELCLNYDVKAKPSNKDTEDEQAKDKDTSRAGSCGSYDFSGPTFQPKPRQGE